MRQGASSRQMVGVCPTLHGLEDLRAPSFLEWGRMGTRDIFKMERRPSPKYGQRSSHKSTVLSLGGVVGLSLPFHIQGCGFDPGPSGCQVIYSQFGLAIHQNDHQARCRFVEWAQNEIAVVPDFHKRILFSDEAHFWLNGYVNKQNCRIWSEANPQVYVETPLHPEKLTVWCALWVGGILLQKR
ncbi:hypothetical protein TNCV_279961 [Trichonephila clavipes]|nr:hypothetical protein TNCV_279961 [Trichonephila clavipes]